MVLIHIKHNLILFKRHHGTNWRMGVTFIGVVCHLNHLRAWAFLGYLSNLDGWQWNANALRYLPLHEDDQEPSYSLGASRNEYILVRSLEFASSNEERQDQYNTLSKSNLCTPCSPKRHVSLRATITPP